MMRALMIGSAILALATPKPAPPVYCDATVQRVASIGVSERLAIRAAPGCPENGIVRARKRSTLNAEGPYIPIYPTRGAWTIRPGETRLEWVGLRWRVEQYDPDTRTWTPARRIP